MNKKEFIDAFITDKASFYRLSLGKRKWIASDDS